MYCDACGNPMADDARFCTKCGKAVAGPRPAAPVAARSRLARHLPALGVLWIVFSALRILSGGAVLLAGRMIFPHFFAIGWPISHFFLPSLIDGLGFGLLALGIAGVVAGMGLMQRESWARMAALILGVVTLIHFPLGTAVGIYTLWVLLPNDAAAEFAQGTHPA